MIDLRLGDCLEEKKVKHRLACRNWRARNKEKTAKYYHSIRERHTEYMRRWRVTHRASIKATAHKHYTNNTKVCLKRSREYEKKCPWVKTLGRILTRCNGKNQPYNKKGIKNLLNCSDLKFLWFRDKAYLMKKASIDRIDPKLGYTEDNYRRRFECKRNG